jgi:hypothetical protein
LKKEFVTIRAEVIHREENVKVLTVKLEDGFGNMKAVVYHENVAKV